MSMKDEFYEQVADIFKKDVGDLTDETRYKEDLNAKSGDYFAVIAAVEELCDHQFTFAQLRKFATLGETAKQMESVKE
jgi:acyl carrier protein